MSDRHMTVAILPSNNLDESAAFYAKLGFHVDSDYGDYRILSDGRGWHLHLNKVAGWPAQVEDNPFGLYLYVDDVDGVAAKLAGEILHPGAPEIKHWGCYEFAVSDPSGTLVRIGRVID